MELGEIVYPKCDIFSHFNKSRMYCKFNEKLRIVAIHGDVLIVEGETEKFPIQSRIVSKFLNSVNSTNKKMAEHYSTRKFKPSQKNTSQLELL